MSLKGTFEILRRSPGDSYQQCFQNGVDVIEFQSITLRHVYSIVNDLGQHWASNLFSITSCIGWQYFMSEPLYCYRVRVHETVWDEF
ncbi:hypothetical protein Y032_0006g3110 [Ancylostoma ceylanicum]|uniref:Uncharacterized protein n=1 Tax=Ancylostoma ceylanicum TaxID=53326 RepID=A0A016VQH4_9BILA|nr:hypothetical protein Y032_0006g3110 [Ancylostoma ceylanicum]